ncbi:MAG: isoaspartyl peptidase/L-asparaginase [Gammaproteobacteria bacterium]|nr:isoaspartyl peptidase/L-asparaginase [Gammaproteobacteria bacterium]
MVNAGPIAIAIHGGAGPIRREKMTQEVEATYRQKLEESVRAGYEALAHSSKKSGASSTDAVVAAMIVMEDSELFNAGKGSVFTHEAEVEMDASIMEGNSLKAGAIAGVRHIRNPIRLASDVMNHSDHVMLIGEGAETYASELGYKLIDNSYFHTERRKRQLQRIREATVDTALSEDSSDIFEAGDNMLGTVGAVAIDRDGNIAAATSTGGMTNKQYGRVGDSPIIGAGTYADNSSCGVSATGHGEYFIRTVVAHDICARVLYKGIGLQQAADEVVMDKLKNMQADGGIIGIDSQANVVFSFNSSGMYRAAIDKNGDLEVHIFK